MAEEDWRKAYDEAVDANRRLQERLEASNSEQARLRSEIIALRYTLSEVRKAIHSLHTLVFARPVDPS